MLADIQGRCSHPPVRCRDLASLSEANQERFFQRCLRIILDVKWQDHVSNEEVVKRASPPSIESILLQVQLRWAGHFIRMEDVRIPTALFFSELQEGNRKRGAPRKRYKDQLKRQIVQAGISHQSWQQETSNRDSWRSSARKASCEFEAHEASSSIPTIPIPNLRLSKVR